MLSVFIKRAALVFALIGLTMLLPGTARAEMVNNLANSACLTCHQNYPAIKSGSTYTIKHKWDKCDTCHTDKATDSMWNCRFCHLDNLFRGGSSFYLHASPTLSEGMNRHVWDGALTGIEATFTYHNNNLAAKHTSTAEADCLSCHKGSLTEEHSGGTTQVLEDFNDTIYNLTFSGSWYRANAYGYNGSYYFRSPAISHNASTTMTTNVNLVKDGKVSFWYRVSSEAGYDKFYFDIDGVQKVAGISGNSGWCQVTFPLTAGSHSLTWKYTKDEAAQWFEDCVCIDEVKVSLGGQPLDCNTCHLSSQPAVKTAISSHNTSCTACHGNITHETVHAYPLSPSCQGSGCHTSFLSTDHKNKLADCATCHGSPKPAVQQAVYAKDKYCGSCHSTGHNINFGAALPNLPLYAGFQWSAPTPLSLWNGDSWVPSDLGAYGYLLMSNRRTDTSADQIWSYYKTQMANQGWVLQTVEPLPGGTDFKVKFTREGKTCYIWYHNLEDHSQPLPDKGARIELFYN